MAALFVLFSYIIHYVSSLKVFNCDSDSLCSSVNICPNNEDCLINCIGNSSCRDKTFQCPANGQCFIQCGSNINDTKSCFRTLFTTKSDTKIISITTYGTNTMKHSTVFCPNNNNIDCFIYSMDGHSQLSNINIYTAHSHHNVNIYCKYPSKCYNLTQYPIIHCLEHSSSCNLDLTLNSFDKWQCIDHQSICNNHNDTDSINTINTTNNYVSITPISTTTTTTTTTSTSTTITTTTNRYKTDNQKIDNNQHMEGIIIGSIFTATFLLVFILVCIIAIYLKKSKLKKEESNIKNMGRRISSHLPAPPPKQLSPLQIDIQSEIELNQEILMIDRNNNKYKNKIYLSKPPSNFSSRQVSELSINGKCKKCFHPKGPFKIGEESTIAIERSD